VIGAAGLGPARRIEASGRRRCPGPTRCRRLGVEVVVGGGAKSGRADGSPAQGERCATVSGGGVWGGVGGGENFLIEFSVQMRVEREEREGILIRW
jgi:hypothetical protein